MYAYMDTRNKLEEARYFLDALIRKERIPKEFIYNLSAFLGAWTSVPDVMLYDFAEHYRIGLTREDRMMHSDFRIVAKAQKNADALQFFNWWRRKLGILSSNKLWNMRNIIVHRGYEIAYRIYVPPSMSGAAGFVLSTQVAGFEKAFQDLKNASGQGIPIEIVATDEGVPIEIRPARRDTLDIELSDLPDLCKKGFAQMKEIVEEAEKTFDVML